MAFGLGQLLIHMPSLLCLEIFAAIGDVSFCQLSKVIFASAYVQAITPQRALRVQLPLVDDEALSAATRLWKGLVGRVAGHRSLLITDNYGVELLEFD